MSDDVKRHDEIQGDIVHVYDGIEEADNQLPTWWVATFVGAIIFAAGYWIVFHSLEAANNPLAAYTEDRLAAANRGGPVTDEELEALASDKLTLSAGEKTYGKYCVKCHGAQGEGKVGPNLTDPNWLYGGAPGDIYQSILTGRPRGMPAWGSSLGPGAVKQLTALVLSKRNTNLPGKEPEGEVWTPPPPKPEGDEATPGGETAPGDEAPGDEAAPAGDTAPANGAPEPANEAAPADPAKPDEGAAAPSEADTPASDQPEPAPAGSPG